MIRLRFVRAGSIACVLALLLGGCAESPPAGAAPVLLGGLGASLVECPTAADTAVRVTLGPRGGAFFLGRTGVMVPPGAVPAPTEFTLRSVASPFLEVELRAGDAGHYEFRRRVAVTIDYSRCERQVLASRGLGVWQIDPLTKAPLEFMGGWDDRRRRVVTFATAHFSTFAVAH